MDVKRRFDEDMVVSFVRIGQDRNVPDLTVAAGTLNEIREQIHDFAAQRLGTITFTVQLWDDHGFLDLGTHSAGAFTLRPADGNPQTAAPTRPPH